jgi:hypothetical protein
VNIERTDAVNWSTLKSIGTSPKHYLHNLNTPREDTEALKLGRLTHALILEPDQVEARYITSPRFNRACNDDTAIGKGYDGGKQAALAWEASVGTREVVDADLFARARAMRDAVLSDPVARPLVTEGYAEHKLTWTDAETGVQCRARIDHLNGVLCDLKTTRSLLTCERDSARFGYAGQLAWYFDGVAASGLATGADPCLLFVENVAPFDVLVLTFTEDDLAIGRRVYRRCLERLAECRATGNWPGVSNGVARRIELPSWTDPVQEVELTIGGEALV